MLAYVKEYETAPRIFRLTKEFCDETKLPVIEWQHELYLPTKFYYSSKEDAISLESLKGILREGYTGAWWLLTQIQLECEGSLSYEVAEGCFVGYGEYMPCGLVQNKSLDFQVVVTASIKLLGQKDDPKLSITVMPYLSSSINIVSSCGPKQAEINCYVLPLLRASFYRTSKEAVNLTDFELYRAGQQFRNVPKSRQNWELNKICKLLDDPSSSDTSQLSQRLAALEKFQVSDHQLTPLSEEFYKAIQCDSQGGYIELNAEERIFLNLVYGLGAGTAALADKLTEKIDKYAVLQP